MAKQDSTYQGWRNYQTWCCALWLSCDAGFDCDVHDYIESLDDDNTVIELADYIESFVESLTPDLGASMFSDLLNAALEEIDYYEIAENYLMA